MYDFGGTEGKVAERFIWFEGGLVPTDQAALAGCGKTQFRHGLRRSAARAAALRRSD